MIESKHEIIVVYHKIIFLYRKNNNKKASLFSKRERKLLYKVIKKMLKYCKQRLTVYTMCECAFPAHCRRDMPEALMCIFA